VHSLTIRYNSTGTTLPLTVPDMGLSPREWAHAVFTATNVPPTNRYGVPGALEVAAAYAREAQLAQLAHPPFGPGDVVHVGGYAVQCVAVDRRADAWGVGVPTFADPVELGAPDGPLMDVGMHLPPPDAIAYVEDNRDRLWTGKGAGEWRCLTDPAGRTAAGLWPVVWREHGPLVPLVPARVVGAVAAL
jgi:hypothetical protein